MNELLGLDPNFPILYIIPLLVFGPIFFTILYQFGLKDLIRPSAEAREYTENLKQQDDQLKTERHQKLSDAGLATSDMKRSPWQWLGQGLTYLSFALVIAYFSNAPAYLSHPPEMAEVRLSLTHPGRHKVECHKRSRAELQKLAANMRAPMSCTRERWPLMVKLALDGETVFQGIAQPAGLSNDGHSSFYEKFIVTGESHRITVQLWDGDGKGKADYILEENIKLSPAEVLVIGFSNSTERLTAR